MGGLIPPVSSRRRSIPGFLLSLSALLLWWRHLRTEGESSSVVFKGDQLRKKRRGEEGESGWLRIGIDTDASRERRALCTRISNKAFEL